MKKASDFDIDLSSMADMSLRPTLSDVNDILGTVVVGEEEARMSLFVNWILARKYVMLSGASRSGKTFLKDAVKDYFLGDMCHQISSGSEKSGWYDMEEIQKAQFIDVQELNQIPKEMLEVLKLWGESKAAKYRVVSHSMATGKKENVTYELPYRPFVFAIADENNFDIPKELRYRLIEIRTDSSEEQNRRIIERQARISKNPRNQRELDTDKLEAIRQHIRTLPSFSKFFYINPAADTIARMTPSKFTDSRTAHPIFVDNVAGIQRFYWKSSLIVTDKRYKKPLMFISPQSMMQSLIIEGRIFINSSLKCNDIQREILEVIMQVNSIVDKKYVIKKLKERGINISSTMALKHLQALCDMTYLDELEHGNTKQYELNEGFLHHTLSISGKEVVEECVKTMKEEFPEYLDAYKEAYLKDPTFIHPNTGERIDVHRFDSKTGLSKPQGPKRKHKVSDYNSNVDEEVVEQSKEDTLTDDDLKLPHDTGVNSTEDGASDTALLLGVVREAGASGYSANNFADKYGEEKMQHMVAVGDLMFKPDDRTKVMVVE